MDDRKAAVLKELDEKFSEIQKEIGFESSLNDIDEIFFIRDYILDQGYVSESLSRQIAGRMAETFMGWNNYLHTLIMPNPHNMINVNESKTFNEAERKEMGKIMTDAMRWVSTSTLAGVNKDKALEKEFIDGSIKFWKEKFGPELIKIMGKIREEWKKK